MTEIIKKQPMVRVKVAFGTETELLYFEGSIEKFKKALWFDFVYFGNLHRHVLTSKIKDFWEVLDNQVITREMRLASLSEKQKEEVKFYISNMKKNIWREPTDKEFDKMIQKVVYGGEKETYQPLSDEKRRKTIEIIQKMREHKAKFWTYNLKNFWKIK